MRRWDNVVASMCGGALLGAWAVGWGDANAVLGAIVGGAIGIWIGWPK